MFTNVALIRGLIRAADGILGHYVAACRASPFHMCRAVADTKEKAFFEAIIRHEQLHSEFLSPRFICLFKLRVWQGDLTLRRGQH